MTASHPHWAPRLLPSFGRSSAFARLGALPLLALLLALPARAAGINHFQPAGGPQNYIVTADPAVLGHFVPSAWSLVTYAHDPLVLRNKAGVEVSKVVEHQLTAEVGGSFGLFDIVELGLSAPGMFLAGAGMDGGGLSVVTLGDPRLLMKVKLTPWQEGLLAAVRVDADLPLARLNPAALGLAGDPFPTLRVGGVVGYRGRWLRTALDLGYVLRAPSALGRQHVGHEMTYGLAAEVPLWPDLLFATGDVFGRVAPSFLFSSSTQAPLEGALGLKAVLGPVQLSAGVGAGLWAGYGTPDARMFLGLGYVHRPAPALPDEDGDGIADDDDRCPAEPEDIDGFEDDDGCPDLDDDGDGVPDAADRCPTEPEDIDGFEDDDGCPDLDHDGDGVPDSEDACPDEAEDMDGWQDDDGCPEADNDGDGIANDDDECPNDPETKNGHLDDDGCPDSLEKDDLAVIVKRDTIEFNEMVFFKRESSRILPRAYPVLKRIAEVINEHTEIRAVLIDGHTDSTGPEEYNRRLSNWRALSVRRFLIRQGVSPKRLRVRGLADTKPAEPNSSASGRARNRRVELHIVGGQPGDEPAAGASLEPAGAEKPKATKAKRNKERRKKLQQKKRSKKLRQQRAQQKQKAPKTKAPKKKAPADAAGSASDAPSEGTP